MGICTPINGGWQYLWADYNLLVTATRLIEDNRRGLTFAELVFQNHDNGQHLRQARISLTDAREKAMLAIQLRALDKDTPWQAIVEGTCKDLLQRFRQGEAVIYVGLDDLPSTPMYRLWPFIIEGELNSLFGSGQSMKSTLSHLWALSIQTGMQVFGWEVQQGNVLILDYETRADTVNMSLRALTRGVHFPPTPILYRRCYRPIADDIEAIADAVYRQNVDVIIVDSATPASGGAINDSETQSRLLAALRSLHRTILLIDHESKGQAKEVRGKGEPANKEISAIGAAVKMHQVRSAWYAMRGAPGLRTVRTSLWDIKGNTRHLHQAGIGLEYVFTEDGHHRWDTIEVMCTALTGTGE